MDYSGHLDNSCSPLESLQTRLAHTHKIPPPGGVDEFHSHVDAADMHSNLVGAQYRHPTPLDYQSRPTPSSVPRSEPPSNFTLDSHNDAFLARYRPDGFAAIPGGEIQPTWAHYPRTESYKVSADQTPYMSNSIHSNNNPSMNAPQYPDSQRLPPTIVPHTAWSPSERAYDGSLATRSNFDATAFPGAVPTYNGVASVTPNIDGFSPTASHDMAPSSMVSPTSYQHHPIASRVPSLSSASNDCLHPGQSPLIPQQQFQSHHPYPHLLHDHRDHVGSVPYAGMSARQSHTQPLHPGGHEHAQNVPTAAGHQDRRRSGYEDTMFWMMMNSRSPDFIRNNSQAFASISSSHGVPAGPPSLTTASGSSKDSSPISSTSPSPPSHSYSSGSGLVDAPGVQSLNPSLTVKPEFTGAQIPLDPIRVDSITTSELHAMLETRSSIPAASLRAKKSNLGGTRQSKSGSRSSASPESHVSPIGITAASLAVAAAMRSAPATTGRPSLACLFCRRRKIACPPPPPDSEDLTCQQCLTRNLVCEYPTHTRRGLPKHRPAKQFTLEDIRSMARGLRDDSTTNRARERRQGNKGQNGAEHEGSPEESAAENDFRTERGGSISGIRKSQRQSTMTRRPLHDFPDDEEDEEPDR